jgi:ketosteroid isomerase-like protein
MWLRQRRLMQPAFDRQRIAGYGGVMTAFTERHIAGWTAGATVDVHADTVRHASSRARDPRAARPALTQRSAGGYHAARFLVHSAHHAGCEEVAMTGAAEADVLRADDRRFEAMRNEDWAALEAVLADDLTYVHSSARLESKKEHVANLRAGKPHYRGIAPRDRRVRVHGDVGIVDGISEMHVENAGKEQRFTVRYVAVYARTGEQWRMLAWQSTRQPDA